MTFDEQLNILNQSDLFEAQWYLETYPDVAAAGMDAIDHFLKYGARMGRDPGPGFSTRFYLKQNPDVVAGDLNPLVHYLTFGQAEGRKPQP